MLNSVTQSFLRDLPWFTIFNQIISVPEQLPSLLKSLGVSSESLAPILVAANSSSEPYGRKIIFKNESIEVMVASWSLKAISSPHNHGASSGVIWFVNGQFTEQHFRFEAQSLEKRGNVEVYNENSVVSVQQSEIHSCGPSSVGVSLHLYSPPIHKMKVWDAEGRRTLTVADECGAWIPEDKNLILDEKAW